MSEPALTRRTFLAGTGLAVIRAAASPDPGRRVGGAAAKVGAAAPAFTAVATTGKTVSLADYKGKLVVLEWTNHECPYVRKHYESGNMQAMQKEATGQGVDLAHDHLLGAERAGIRERGPGRRADQDARRAPTAVLLRSHRAWSARCTAPPTRRTCT